MVVAEATVATSVHVVRHLCLVVRCRRIRVVDHRAHNVAPPHVVDCSGVLAVLSALSPRLSAEAMMVVVVVVHLGGNTDYLLI